MAKFLKNVSGAVAEEATIEASAGSGDSGKVAHLNGSGVFDLSMIPTDFARRVLLGSDVSTTATTASNVTGLSFSVKSGVTYQFDFAIWWTCAATTSSGIGLSLNGPAGNVAYFVDTPTSATARTLGNRRAYDTFGATTAIDAASSLSMAFIRGIVTPTADGTLIVRLRAGTSGSAAVVKAGSSGLLRAMGTDSAGSLSSPVGLDDVGSTSYTLVLGDAGRVKKSTSGSATTFTVPPASSVSQPLGTIIGWIQGGSGTLSFAEGSGVTIRTHGATPKSSAGQYAQGTLMLIGADEWLLSGQTATS